MTSDMMNPSQRSAATDMSHVNPINKDKPAPAEVHYTAPRDGSGMTPNGPSQVVEGIYVQPEAGRAH